MHARALDFRSCFLPAQILLCEHQIFSSSITHCSQNAWPLVFGDSRYSICWLRCSCSFPSLDLRLILLSYSLEAGYIHYLFEVHFSGCEHDATFATLVKYFCLYVWLQGFRITRQIDYFVITVKTQPKSSSEVAVAWTQCLIIREYLTPTW